MNVSETPIDAEMLSQFTQSAREGCALIKADFDQQSPAEIVALIDAYILEGQRTHATVDQADVLLGSLWGEMLVRQLGWEWASIIFHDYQDAMAIGVFSPDRSLAIYPFHFIYGCLESNAPVTIELAFQVLVDGTRIPKLPPRGYENVMDNVHHST